MDDANDPLTVEDLQKLLEQLRAENASLRSDNAALLEQHEAAQQELAEARQQLAEAQQQLAEARRQLAQTQAELESLTHATGVLDGDRNDLKAKVAELQASVDRLANMLWGRRSEKRPDKNQQTLFELQSTPDELSAQEQAILDAEKLSDESKRKLLDELLKRRQRRLKKPKSSSVSKLL